MRGASKKKPRILARIPGRAARVSRAALLRCSIAAGLAFALAPAPAAAQMACGVHAEIARRLAERWGETPFGGGLVSPRQLVELWVSEARDSWTLLTVTPEGRACVLAIGRGWRMRAAPGPGTPSSSPIPRGGRSPDPDARAGAPPRPGPAPDFPPGRGGALSLSRAEPMARGHLAGSGAGLAPPRARPFSQGPF